MKLRLAIVLCVFIFTTQVQKATSRPDEDRSEESEDEDEVDDDESSEEMVQQQTSVDPILTQKSALEIQRRNQTSVESTLTQKSTLEIQRRNQTQPEQLQNPCLEPKEIGKCKLFLPRYFFNSATTQCERFAYGGCGRNGNNFHSLFDCESKCASMLSIPEEVDVPVSSEYVTGEDEPEVCEMPPVSPGHNCKAYLPRWTFNKNERRCVQFIYSGCGATENMYLRKYDCQQQCGNYEPKKNLSQIVTTTVATTTVSPTTSRSFVRSTICDQPLDTGSCFSMIRRYYFNAVSNRCLSFTFNGCGGNDNNFQNGDDCLRTCGGSTPAENVACAHVSCPTNLYSHYAALGCEPLYDGNACCPTRYYCQSQKFKIKATESDAEDIELEHSILRNPKCSYRGKLYAVGADIPEASSKSACRAACTCALFGTEKARINCANIECPETLGVRPAGKENCTLLYKRGECCAFDYHCADNEIQEQGALLIQKAELQSNQSEISEQFRCSYAGKEYVPGERMEIIEDTCRICTCAVGFNATLTSEFCEPIDCGIEIYYADQLESGCVPVYYQDAENRIKCCPIGWQCPEDDTVIISAQATTTAPPRRRPPPQIPGQTRAFVAMAVLTPDAGIVTTDACVLPPEVGPCKGRRPRYYFNQLTRKCEPFTYGGCGGNQNNFVALQDCLRICGNNFTQTRSGAWSSQFRNRSTVLQSHESTVHELTEVDACTQVPKLGSCRGYFRRYYYAPELDECTSFVYSGCGGNKNNFYSEESCAAFCQNRISSADLVQERVSETTVHNSTGQARHRRIQNYTGSVQPTSPVPQFSSENPCRFPVAKGPCRGVLQRFYFDPSSSSCKQFVYGGCGGNDNNFVALRECELKCQAKRTANQGQGQGQVQLSLEPKWRNALGISGPLASQEAIPELLGFFERCQLPRDAGSCRAKIPAFYYDIDSRTCKPFAYGGCFGNPNRFSSLAECDRTCRVSETGTSPNRNLSNLGTNPQLQESETGVEQSEEICSLPVIPGDCRAHKLRFHWNSKLAQCVPFVYSGCKGNRNNFLSEGDCLSACAVDPPIETVAHDGILTCTFGNQTIPIGGVLGGATFGGSTCGRPICTCTTPPALTCTQRQCPTPPFVIIQQLPSTQKPQEEEPASSCPPITCRPNCRSTLGSNGCHFCLCRNSNFPPANFTVPPIPVQRKLDSPCKMIRCAPPCRLGIDEVSSCPLCNCASNSDLLQQRQNLMFQ